MHARTRAKRTVAFAVVGSMHVHRYLAYLGLPTAQLTISCGSPGHLHHAACDHNRSNPLPLLFFYWLLHIATPERLPRCTRDQGLPLSFPAASRTRCLHTFMGSTGPPCSV
jgi:hypothetical protein